jgi:predicted ATPase
VIKNWKLTCFKSIRDADIDLATLTIFAGPNSSGKSSFFQSILLLSQTMRSWNNNPLVLKGEYANLGQYKDIVCDKSPNKGKQISIGFSIAAAEPDSFSPMLCGGGGSGGLVFGSGHSGEDTGEKAALISAHFEWPASGPAGSGEPFSFDFILNAGAGAGTVQPPPVKGRMPGKSAWKDRSALSADSVEVVNEFSGKIEKIEFDSGNTSAAYFNHFLPEKIEYYDSSNNSFLSRLLPVNIRGGIEDFQKYFTRYIKYLGPLRASPNKCYSINDADTEDIGAKGENMPSVLFENRDTIVNFLLPDYFETPGEYAFVSDNEPVRLDPVTLGKAVNRWIGYIGVADVIDVVKREDDYIPTADGKYFTHVGVGVSQVVPIIVMCLLAPKCSTIIVEQPELHLHPKMQSRLADFFIAVSLSGKQCLIETHSEHMVNQLCYRYASMPNDDILKDKSKIYFVEKYEGISMLRSIDIDKYGALSDWPEDFFDESQISTDKIIDAVTKKIEAEDNND